MMRTANRPWILLGAVGCLSGCTTLVPHTSIEPYIKDKQKRNAIELIAETYCREKRLAPGSSQPEQVPNYIFTTDGCSRWPDDSWLICCVVHDISYWCGGSAEDRKEADALLMQCASSKVSLMGDILYAAVRLGGVPWLPTPWRWGYGWDDWPRGYEPINHSPSVRKLLEKLNVRGIVEEHFRQNKAIP